MNKRENDTKRIIEIIKRYPKINARGIQWVMAGGYIKMKGGFYELEGKTKRLTTAELIKTISIKSRVSEACKLEIIKRTNNLVAFNGEVLRGKGFVIGNQ